MRFLYDVSAFLTNDKPLSVNYHPAPADRWPVHIRLGPGGDAIDVFADVDSARKLRDALTAALSEGEPANDNGSWERIEDVPADVQVVLDREGDYLVRGDGNRFHLNGMYLSRINDYAPFRRA